jgi:homoserine O-succinyltransferase
LSEIFDWAKSHVTSTLYICWAALAGMYYHYGVPKHVLPSKISGVFQHRVYDKQNPIFRGFDDVFYAPHSRHSTVLKEDVLKVPELSIISESDEAGIYMVMARNGREFYIMGHSEYSPMTLDFEYHRDLEKGLNPHIPSHYYPDDDPSRHPIVRWRAHANLLFTNWLNYFVYQETPYDIRNIK